MRRHSQFHGAASAARGALCGACRANNALAGRFALLPRSSGTDVWHERHSYRRVRKRLYALRRIASARAHIAAARRIAPAYALWRKTRVARVTRGNMAAASKQRGGKSIGALGGRQA